VDKVFGWLKNYIQERHPKSQAELENSIEEAWEALPQTTIQKWILHCRTVCNQLIAHQGATIPE
jgi:hypothetical protein